MFYLSIIMRLVMFIKRTCYVTFDLLTPEAEPFYALVLKTICVKTWFFFFKITRSQRW